jgi:hypothetical protein
LRVHVEGVVCEWRGSVRGEARALQGGRCWRWSVSGPVAFLVRCFGLRARLWLRFFCVAVDVRISAFRGGVIGPGGYCGEILLILLVLCFGGV